MALSVFETQQSTNPLVNGALVEFETVETEIGSTGNFDGSSYECPISGFYFIYYRLLLDVFDPSCGVNLNVGADVIEVNLYAFALSHQNMCKFFHKHFIVKCVFMYVLSVFFLTGYTATIWRANGSK